MIDERTLPGQGSPAPFNGAGWYIVAMLAVSGALAFIHRGILNIIVTPLQTDLGLNNTQFGLVQASVFAVMFAIGSLLAGRAADRFKRRNLIMAGVVLWTLGTLLCAMAVGFWSLAAGRTLVGLGTAVVVPVVISALGDAFPELTRARAFAVVFMGFVLGDCLWVSIGGLLLTGAQGHVFTFLGALAPWRQLLVLASIPAIPILIALMFMREPARGRQSSVSGEPTSETADPKFLLNNWRVFAFYLLGGAAFTIGGSSLNWVPEILQRSYHVSPARLSGEYGTVLLICGILGIFIGGAIGPRVARRGASACLVIVAACYTLVGIGMLALLTSSTSLVYLTSGAFQLEEGLSVVLLSSAIAMLTPSRLRGTVSGIERFVIVLIGNGIGQPLVGYVADRMPPGEDTLARAIMLVAIPAFVFGSICMLFAARSASRQRLASSQAENAASLGSAGHATP